MAFRRRHGYFSSLCRRGTVVIGRTMLLLGVLSLLMGFLSLPMGQDRSQAELPDTRLPPKHHDPVAPEDEISVIQETPSSSASSVGGLFRRLFHSTLREAAKGTALSLVSPDELRFKNLSGYDIDPAVSAAAFRGFPDSGQDPLVLVIHTHTTEAYTPDDRDSYTASDPFRTLDPKENMLRVGDALCEVLEARGIRTLHDETLYDYPNYNNAYDRSMESIERWLAQYPGIRVVLDLHRDAIEYADGSAYRTLAQVDGQDTAQVMILCGSDGAGLYHPRWQENLSFAFTLQSHMDALYPGLSRPMKISQYRYNTQATTGSLLIEVGSHGNTMEESLRAVRCFGEALADVLSADLSGSPD